MRITVGQLRRIIREAVDVDGPRTGSVVWHGRNWTMGIEGVYTSETQRNMGDDLDGDSVGAQIFLTYRTCVQDQFGSTKREDDSLYEEIDPAEALPGFIKLFNSPPSKGKVDAPLRAAFKAFADRLRGSKPSNSTFEAAVGSANVAYDAERQAQLMGGDQRGPRQSEALRRRR